MAKKKKRFFFDFPNGYKTGSGKKRKKKSSTRAPFYRRTYEQLGAIVEGIKDIGHMKESLRNMGWYLALLAAGLTLVLFGIAKYLDCLCTQLACGLSFVLVGLAAIVISLIYKRVAR